MVANTSKEPTRLFKYKKVATLDHALRKIVLVREEVPSYTVKAVPIYKGKLNQEQQLGQHQQVTKVYKEKERDDWKNKINVTGSMTNIERILNR